VSEREDALRATTGDLIADAAELDAIEHRKAAMDPDDPRQDQLAAEAEALVRQMVPKAAAQREIVTGDDGASSPFERARVEADPNRA
jgi:capsule polysaccharide export protein KpsE/RkpR